ncbi:MAG: ATP-binding protein [Oscillospiraceae bacterium]|nr:ATP-binding protein [Oscillospiraceae bacterium]
MKTKMFLYFVLIMFLGLTGFFSVSIYMNYINNFDIARTAVTEITEVCAGLYSDMADTELSSFVQTGKNTRITIISSEGTVLADSRPIDLEAAENHLDRPEIQAAAAGNPEAHIRYSETLGLDLIYYALKADTETGYVFIRAAFPVSEIDVYLFRSLPLLVLILLAVAALCFAVIHIVIHRMVRPFASIEHKLRLLANGEYIFEPIAGSYDEIEKITREIDEISIILQDSFDSMHDEKNKLDYIINNIGDGIFAVDENKNITLINNAALNIFDVTPDITGKSLNYLSREKTLIAAVEDCLVSENNTIFEMPLSGKIFFATVKRLPGTKLTMAVLTDVTETRENAKRREEFFANASHELKTPLTAIKGFNELSDINNTDKNIKKYIESIARETDRMLSLIGDMLKLSELESSQSINPVNVSLADVINEVREIMLNVIEEKSISFTTDGDALVAAEREHIYELVKNLIENAVRYNDQGGKTTVIVESLKSDVKLIVADNGIGIPPEEQTRIFERFYRVEKSRSQRGGGTGLGLSIVKHICALYGWKLSLKSKLGIGTEITVVFNAVN